MMWSDSIMRHVHYPLRTPCGTDSLSDAQLQTALDRLEKESKLRKVAQRAAIVAHVKLLRAESEIVAAPPQSL